MSKLILLSGLAALLSACAHETTQMDREMALILAKRGGETHIVQSAPPVINVYNGGSNAAAPAAASAAAVEPDDARTNCVNSPVYSMNGKFLHYQKNCFGGE